MSKSSPLLAAGNFISFGFGFFKIRFLIQFNRVKLKYLYKKDALGYNKIMMSCFFHKFTQPFRFQKVAANLLLVIFLLGTLVPSMAECLCSSSDSHDEQAMHHEMGENKAHEEVATHHEMEKEVESSSCESDNFPQESNPHSSGHSACGAISSQCACCEIETTKIDYALSTETNIKPVRITDGTVISNSHVLGYLFKKQSLSTQSVQSAQVREHIYLYNCVFLT